MSSASSSVLNKTAIVTESAGSRALGQRGKVPFFSFEGGRRTEKTEVLLFSLSTTSKKKKDGAFPLSSLSLSLSHLFDSQRIRLHGVFR